VSVFLEWGRVQNRKRRKNVEIGVAVREERMGVYQEELGRNWGGKHEKRFVRLRKNLNRKKAVPGEGRGLKWGHPAGFGGGGALGGPPFMGERDGKLSRY